MEILSPVALLGWLPVACCLFLLLPGQKAVLVSFLVGWLFLPVANLPIRGFLDYNKSAATSGILLAAIFFDSDKLPWKIRPSKMDIPVILWCVCPLASSLTNGLGIYDGAAGALEQFVTWGVPYLIGRAYFGTTEGLDKLAIAIFVSGLVYVPLCLYEIRMSPQLHKALYGMHQNGFGQNWRFGGWRPTVFLQHGLAVGMWMTTASVIGFVLSASKSLRSLWVLPMSWLVLIVSITTLLCKSTGAIILLLGGCAAYLFSILLKSKAILVGMVFIVPLYLTVRVAARWSGEGLISLSQTMDEDRSQSLKTRLDNENSLVDRAMLKPAFGWGRWGRSRIYNDEGEDLSITDSKWIIALGESGIVGLVSFFSMLLLPALRTIIRPPFRSGHAPSVGLAICLTLYSMDNLLNAMSNPIFMLIAGGLSGAYNKASDDSRVSQEKEQALSLMAAR